MWILAGNPEQIHLARFLEGPHGKRSSPPDAGHSWSGSEGHRVVPPIKLFFYLLLLRQFRLDLAHLAIVEYLSVAS